MGPVLREICRTKSCDDLAYLLEKHIGNEPSAIHCKEAYDALLARCSEDSSRLLAETMNAFLGDDYCQVIRRLIDALRKNALDSQHP